MDAAARHRTWTRLIRHTRRRVNFAWWLERLGPLLLGTSVAAAGLVLYLRSQPGAGLPLSPLTAAVLTAITLLLFVLAWLLARPRFISEDEAAVRLEDRLGLHNALTAARSGIAPWPEPRPAPIPRTPPDGLRWDWPRIALTPLAALATVVVPFLIPIRPAEASVTAPNEPTAWEEMEEWLEQLEEEEIVADSTLEELERAIEELRAQPAETWFQHHSLEATDTLREGLQRSLANLEENLSEAQRNLTPLSRQGDALSEAARERLERGLTHALAALEAGELGLSEELRQSLESLEPGQLQSLDPAQAQAAAEQMRQNAQALREMLEKAQGEGWNPGEGTSQSALELLGEGPGSGGISRGPGDAPMFHKDDPADLASQNLRAISNPDTSRAAPGDLIDLSDAPPDASNDPSSPARGGAVSSAGRGGDRVWEDRVLPAEQAVLKRYFE